MLVLTKVERNWMFITLLSVLSLSATFTMFFQRSRKPRSSSLDKSAEVNEPSDLSFANIGPHSTVEPELGQRTCRPSSFAAGNNHVENSDFAPETNNEPQVPATNTKSLQSKLSSNGINVSYTAEHRKRVQQMTDGCSALHTDDLSIQQLRETPAGTVSLYVNDAQRYIYCRIPKVASTTWVRVLLIASGKVQYTDDPNGLSQDEAYYYLRHKRIFRPLASYTLNEIKYRLKNYFKFLFVRHPFDRLVSSYKDRLQLNHIMPKKIFGNEIRKYRRQTDHIGPRERGVQFAEFVRYVSSPTTKAYNQHWRPQYTLCHPCIVKYDFVGYYETLMDDAKVVLGKIGAPPGVRYPSSDRDNNRVANRTARVARMFSDVDISSTDVDRLRTVVYAKDFAVFCYD